ncbi:MAG: hypothetical protein GXO65_02165 [Euryarchaeota archaeon]|nr:hypothetical protein [Euryarchaeota archaeon]
MPTISIRVDDETKRAMDARRDINWSEVVRRGIKERLKMEEIRRIDRRRLLDSIEVTQKLRRKSPGFDSTKEIRRWREARR